MAGCAKFVYNKRIQSISAIQWSDDFRVAVPADGAVIVYDLQCSPYQDSERMVLHQSSIPSPTHCTNLPGISQEQCYERMDHWPGASYDEIYEFVFDRTLCPFRRETVQITGYKSAKWSPRGADIRGRCVLATLTVDHELCVYQRLSDRWQKVADLSRMYRNSSDFKMDNDMKYQKYKEGVYGISAVEICWSDTYSDETGRYCLLAVIMKNRDLVLWKVKFPITSSSDFIMLKKHNSIEKSTVKCLCVAKPTGENTGLLITGHCDGTLYAHVIHSQTGELVHRQSLYSEEDLMMVSCVKCLSLSQDRFLVIATKEYYVLGYVMQFNMGGLCIEADSMVIGPHRLSCTGLSVRKATSLMCTDDGYLIRIIHSYNNKELSLTLSKCAHLPDEKLLGIDLSNNGIIQAYMTWPTVVTVDTRIGNYFPLKVMVEAVYDDVDILQKALEVNLLDETVPNKAMLDVLEIYRQNLWNGVNPIPSLTDYISHKDKWWSLPVKFLQILRYFLITISRHIPNDTDKKTEEEIALNQSNVLNLGNLIFAKYIKHSLDTLQTQSQQWNDTEKEIASSMYLWLNLKQEYVSQLPLEVDSPIDVKVHNCCICDENLSIESSGVAMQCINGHTFGLCCKTFTPCAINYRVCTLCKSQAQELEYFSDVPWMESNLCTLCDGLLL